jgi:glutaryl-CoA dehydrogenase
MATCEILGAFALTEPKHGSDVVALETRARRQGDEWVLDGHKRWIGNGTVADVVVVWARDDDGQVGAFVVEHPDGAEHPVPGYHARKIVGKAANRGVWQAQIRLDGVRVPAGARLTKARTWDDTNYVLAKSRQTVAWEARCRRSVLDVVIAPLSMRLTAHTQVNWSLSGGTVDTHRPSHLTAPKPPWR